MKKIANKYYDSESSTMYDKNSALLDILLISKFGSKRINPVLKEFTNNMGVINSDSDLELLADTVVAFYKDMWDKRYDAITLEYNILEPYKVQMDSEINEASTDTMTITNNESSSKTSDGDNTITYNIKDSETKDLTDVSTGSTTDSGSTNISESTTIDHDEGGTDTTTTNYGTNGLKDERTLVGSKTKEIEGSIKTTDDTINDEGKENKVTTEITNNPLGEGETDARGVEHSIEGDITEEERLNRNAVTPYAPVNMRYTDESESPKENNTVERNLTLEKTVDYSTQKNIVDTEYHTEKETTYDNYVETEGFNNYKDTNVKTGEVTETLVKDDNFDETTDKTVTSNNDNTQISNTTDVHSGTDINEKTGTQSSITNGTEVLNKSNNGVQDNEGTKDTTSSSTEHGNKWGFTNQSLILEELELRKTNFYEQLLSDVASLLTLSVYSKEELA